MATYDIDKITLPSGDVCNLTIPDASATQAGKVNTDSQKIAGVKFFASGSMSLGNGLVRDTRNYSQIQFYDQTFAEDPTENNGTRAGNIACVRSSVGSSLGNIIQVSIRSPLADGTGYTSYYDHFRFPAPSNGKTADGNYVILTTKNPHDIPVETITATAGTSVSIISQNVKRTGNVVAGYIRFTSSASIAPYAYVINSLPAAAHGAVFTLFDQYNGQINNSTVCLYMDVNNSGLRVSSANLAANTYNIYFNYICS
jgi:hypothetical protein